MKEIVQAIRGKIREIESMCNSLYPEGEDPDSEMNGGPKTVDMGKPMESDFESGDGGEGKAMKKKMISQMIAKKIGRKSEDY